MGEQSAPNGNNQQEFEQIVTELQKRLYQAVISWGFNPTDATEIVQETVVRFWCNRDGKQWASDIEYQNAYLSKIARNLSCDLLRRRKKENLLSSDEPDEQLESALDCKANECDTSAADVQQRIYLEELYRDLPMHIFLHGLSDADLYILWLRVCEGMSLKEIAQELGLDVDTLRYRLQKILASVRYRTRKYLEETHQEGIFIRNA